MASAADAALRPRDPAQAFLVFFHAAFHEACAPGGAMDQVLSTLLAKHTNVQLIRVDAEQAESAAEALGVQVVPTCVLMQGGKVLDKVEGYEPAKLADVLSRVPKAPALSGAAARLQELALSSRVFCFVGPDAGPLLEVLKPHKHATLNLESDAEIKALLGGQTTLFVDGQKLPRAGQALAGKSAEEIETLLRAPAAPDVSKRPKQQTQEDRLRALVTQEPIMLFMKGVPEQPRCGFSAKIVAILNEAGVKYGSFDILTDDAVRQGLKTLFEWPTYPQLYAHGKLIGGLDIVKELKEEGELLSSLGQ